MFDETVRGIHVKESENLPNLVDMRISKELFFCEDFTSEFMVREAVYNKIIEAQKHLPEGYCFMIYEAYRPLSRQIELWDEYMQELKEKNPTWSEEEYIERASIFVANPHGFGSGHQSGAAIDITLCDKEGTPYNMGTELDAFGEKAKTDNDLITEEERRLRNILKTALEKEGLVNYSEEWWHFSYGDRLWAEILGKKEAFFAPIS